MPLKQSYLEHSLLIFIPCEYFPLDALLVGGMLASPGWGTFFGVPVVGGQYRYKYGKEVTSEFIGEGICDSLT